MDNYVLTEKEWTDWLKRLYNMKIVIPNEYYEEWLWFWYREG